MACCKRVLKWMPDECLPAVAMAERLAEGPVDEAERWAVFEAAGEAKDMQSELSRNWAAYCAYRAVGRPKDYDQPAEWYMDGATSVANVAAQPASWVNGQWDSAILMRERQAIAALIRDIFGNPFRPVDFDPAWRTAQAVQLAQDIYDHRQFDRLPFLGDVLEQAGCHHADVLTHCREAVEHVRGCWVVDLILSKS